MEHGYALATTLNQKKTKAAIFLLLKNICLQGLLSVATTTALASGETGEKRQDKRERLRAVNSGDVKRRARGKNRERREREAWGGERRGEEGRGGETKERGGGGKGKGGSHLRRNAGGKRQRGKRKLIS